ncbi:MAG TPA: hypothetical protein VFV34_17060 [Blastocatellia bacterium]|nr:hypothetical protein [Blastocatellia bacterium]
MESSKPSEYVLTIVQHNFCKDCVSLKNKITDVYYASGMNRGDDSQHWRIHIISPPWDRNDRLRDFPRGFQTVEIPAVKLEVDKAKVFATQNPALISELLTKLKWLLINRHTNVQIEGQIAKLVQEWVDSPSDAACPVDSRTTGQLRVV